MQPPPMSAEEMKKLQNISQQPIISPIDTASAAKLPPGVIPTQVIHQPDMSAVMAMATKSLPYGLTIAISGQSIFGAKDVTDIGNKLGLSRDQISSNCILTVRGIMRTDKGATILDGGATPSVSVRYDGVIQDYLMAAQALCTVGSHLPPGSGFLTETNGRYSVPLQQITCPAPKQQVTQLTITYTGDGKSQCAYQ